MSFVDDLWRSGCGDKRRSGRFMAARSNPGGERVGSVGRGPRQA